MFGDILTLAIRLALLITLVAAAYAAIKMAWLFRNVARWEKEAKEEAIKKVVQDAADEKAREELRGRMIGGLNGWLKDD